MKKQKKKKNQATRNREQKKAGRKVSQKLKRKDRRSVEEILWSDLSFLKSYPTEKSSILLDSIFKSDVRGWVECWAEPKNATEAQKLFDEQIVYDLLRSQIESCIGDWSKDTQGFSIDSVPPKFRFSDSTLEIYLQNIEDEMGEEWNEEVKEESLKLAHENKGEWFLNVHDSTLHELSLKLADFIASELRIEAMRYENGLM